MDEVKIHTGTRVKLKKLGEEALPAEFLDRLRQLAHKEDLIQALYLFILEKGEGAEQPSLAVGLKSGILSRNDNELRRIVDEVQMLLPEGLELTVYRLDASPPIARYCFESLQPLYLRSASWLARQRRSLKE